MAIVGGGPAGMAAAIQLSRFDLQPVIFEKKRLGGLLWNAQWVENYPGFFPGISGPQLVDAFKAHLKYYKVQVVKKKVHTIGYEINRERFILDAAHDCYEADILVIATGTKPRKDAFLTIIPRELRGLVKYEVVRLLPEKGKCMVVIGGGDIAFDYALNLSIHNEVTILHRHEEIKALPLLQRRVQESQRITLIGSTVPIKVEKGKNRGLKMTYIKKTGDQTKQAILDCDYMVLAIGREQELPCWDNYCLEKKEALMAQGRLFFAGDVVNGGLRQVAIATGNGIEIAMKINDHLAKTNTISVSGEQKGDGVPHAFGEINYCSPLGGQL